MRHHKTSKLFYGKYPYKAEFDVEAWYFRRYHIQNLVNLQETWQGFKKLRAGRAENLIEFSKAAQEFFENKVKFRAEGATLSMFSMDKISHDNICKKLEYWLIAATEPSNDEDLEFLLTTTKQILCDRLPHGKYQYRVYLKTSLPLHIRLRFYEWTTQYPNDIKMPTTTSKWLQGIIGYTWNPFIYISTEKQLTMVGMFLSGYMTKKQEFVPRNTLINSVSEEELCPP